MQKVPALVGKSCFSSMLQVTVQGVHVYNTSVGKLLQHYNTTDSTLQITALQHFGWQISTLQHYREHTTTSVTNC